MNEEKLKSVWKDYADKNNYLLNPDKEHIEFIVRGVLENEKKFGLKLCPCRLRDGSRKRDLELVCPCNFEIQKSWSEKGQCWCGLFVKNGRI